MFANDAGLEKWPGLQKREPVLSAVRVDLRRLVALIADNPHWIGESIEDCIAADEGLATWAPGGRIEENAETPRGHDRANGSR